MTELERKDIFERWINEHRPLVSRTVRAFASPADADDLMQELLLALWKAVPLYRSESRVSTFVYRVAHNAALTWWRSRTRRPLESLPKPELVSECGNAASQQHDERLLQSLYEHIHRLPPVDRSLMLLSLDDLSYEEIGAIHGMKANLVGVRLHRLRKQLIEDMKGNLNEL